MNSRSRFLLRNFGILTISNFTSKLLVFFLVPLYTSVLTTEEYGSYDIVFSTIQLLLPVLTLNISDAVMRFSLDKEKKIDDVAVIGLRILLLGDIPVIVFLLGCSIWNWIPSINGYEILIMIYFILISLQQYLIQLAKGLEMVTDMGIAGIISASVLLFGNIFFLLTLHMGLRGFYLANLLAQLASVIYLYVKVKIWKFHVFNSVDESLKMEMLKYSIPLIATVIGWWVNSTADKYTVTIMCGTSANGLLSVSYKIPSIINVVQTIFIQAWQISAIKEYESNDKSSFSGRYFYIFNVVLAAVCSWLIILAKPIGRIMYSNEFYAAWEYVPFLLVASVLNSSAGFLGPILAAKKDSESMAKSAIYGAVANVIFNIVLVFILGIQGATIATTISSLIIYIIRKKSLLNEITNEKKVLVYITWSLLCAQAIIEIYTPFWKIEVALMIVMLLLNGMGILEICNFKNK